MNKRYKFIFKYPDDNESKNILYSLYSGKNCEQIEQYNCFQSFIDGGINVIKVRFEDGVELKVFEDELLEI